MDEEDKDFGNIFYCRMRCRNYLHIVIHHNVNILLKQLNGKLFQVSTKFAVFTVNEFCRDPNYFMHNSPQRWNFPFHYSWKGVKLNSCCMRFKIKIGHVHECSSLCHQTNSPVKRFLITTLPCQQIHMKYFSFLSSAFRCTYLRYW